MRKEIVGKLVSHPSGACMPRIRLAKSMALREEIIIIIIVTSSRTSLSGPDVPTTPRQHGGGLSAC